MKLARFWLVHIPNLHLEVLFRCSVLLDPCQYVLSSVNFIFCNQESFQTNLCTHNINTRNKHHLHRPNAALSCSQKITLYAGINIFSSLLHGLTILKNEKAKFKVTLRKYLNTLSLYSLAKFFM